MKLGCESTGQLLGDETLKTYEEFCLEKNAVWFSTNSLSHGMEKARLTQLLAAIKNGQIVEMFSVWGKLLMVIIRLPIKQKFKILGVIQTE